MNKKILQRFEELENEIISIEDTKEEKNEKTAISVMFDDSHEREINTYIDQELLLKWEIQVEDLLSKIVNNESIYYTEFINTKNLNYASFQKLKIIFSTLKNDYEKGYLTSIKTLVQAEVFESQLEQSEELLKSGYTLASAVIAGVVLETSIREICTREKIIHESLNQMNNSLAKKGVYNKLQHKRIIALANIRNSAAHGKEKEFSKEDVVMMIRDIEHFLAKYLDD